ncbi:MAG: PilN domain-containing protein [Patescibacteria group bacterium]|nr:PilN domain-containing protein [Patescibacteria group bacterium]
MKTKIKSINLLRKKGLDTVDEFVNWALSIGRLIVILTEVIALSAFLYRFSLDRKIIDLHDKISQKQVLLKLLKSNEDKFRNLQTRMQENLTLEDVTAKTPKVLKEIADYVPENTSLVSFSMSKDSVRLETSSSSVPSAKTFLKTLKASPIIESVSLDRIENKASSGKIVLILTLELKKN